MTISTDPPFRDHVARLIEKRRKETPDAPLNGMEILSRAERLFLLSRPAIEAVFAKHGIDTGEFDVLATLQRSGPPYTLRPTELYQALMISSGGLTDRLSRLQAKGLITREPSPADKRSLLVKLTPDGRKTITSAFAEDMKVELDILSALTESEQNSLAHLLAKLLFSLERREAP